MKKEIRIAIIGVGNCASSLIQGLSFYKNTKIGQVIPGLLHQSLGGYRIEHIKPVVAFDIDIRKVSSKDKLMDISRAVFEKPNCTKKFTKVPVLHCPVLMGHILDGFPTHMARYPRAERFLIAREKPVNVVLELKKRGAQILINYLPTGSTEATKFYARCALKANCAFINCIPEFIASNIKWQKRFERSKLPLLGDDIKSQLGATIVHRTLVQLFFERAIELVETYQYNYGGNTDFLNMLSPKRVQNKLKSKAKSILNLLPRKLVKSRFYAGPKGYLSKQRDNKTADIILKGLGFGGLPVEINLNLRVEDSPNSAGIVVDAIRCAKLALDRKIGGALVSPSANFFKSPPIDYPDSMARQYTNEFIAGKRRR